MKHEWRKQEKHFYLPKTTPEIIDVPKLKFFTLAGSGNPNSDEFPDYIQVLYSLSYAIKMSPKKGLEPEGYVDYAVYPLEGIWDLAEDAKASFNGSLNKDDLVFNLMIRQPDFVKQQFASEMVEQVKLKKPHDLLERAKFEEITEGKCVQMLHLGSYDSEPESFRKMEAFAAENGLERISKTHREIYLTDARKVIPEKLKTVLRFQVR